MSDYDRDELEPGLVEEGIDTEDEALEDDLDMGMDADGNPIAGLPSDPSETDGFNEEEETF